MIDRIIMPRLLRGAKHVLLLGPRQVGKSTLIRALKPRLIINFADEAVFLAHARDPGLIRREVEALEKPGLIAIDEVQRLPSLLNTVQALIDERSGPSNGRGLRFILTGSSARKLKRGEVNLLPGRVVIEHLDPLSVWELGKTFDLDRALRMGTLPGVYRDPAEGEDVLSAYASIYLREEIHVEAVVKNIGGYARFLDAAAESSGDWINYSKLASDAEIPKETVRRFYGILEDTMLAFKVPSWQPRHSARRVSQRDRFIFFDTGVRNALLGRHRATFSPEETGKLFEQWILLQCLFFIRSYHKEWRVYSYRTNAGAEVDIVIDTGRKLLAIECKFSRKVSEVDLRGLHSFREVAQGRRVDAFILFRGENDQKFACGSRAVPYLRFLREVLTEA